MSGSKIDGKYVRLSVGRCEACNRELQESEMYIKGHLSNVELGLCRKCAQYVNNPSVINADDNDWSIPNEKRDYENYKFRDFSEAPVFSLNREQSEAPMDSFFDKGW